MICEGVLIIGEFFFVCVLFFSWLFEDLGSCESTSCFGFCFLEREILAEMLTNMQMVC